MMLGRAIFKLRICNGDVFNEPGEPAGDVLPLRGFCLLGHREQG